MNKMCIYHKSCADGFGAALAVYCSPDWGVDTQFLAAQHGDTPPDVTGKDVIIVDFSYPRAVLEKMHRVANSVLVLDHHKTAEKALEGLDYCIFNMEKSGAVLTWEYLFPNQKVPLLIEYIQDRDLWQWALPDSKAVSAVLDLYPMEFELWQSLIAMDESAMDTFKSKGQAIVEYQQAQVSKAVKKHYLMTVSGYDVPCMNCTTLISEMGNNLSQDYPFSITYFDTEDKRIFSLRSQQEGGADVGEIASKLGQKMIDQYGPEFNGGGHVNAAGFDTELSPTEIKKQVLEVLSCA